MPFLHMERASAAFAEPLAVAVRMETQVIILTPKTNGIKNKLLASVRAASSVIPNFATMIESTRPSSIWPT